jgi:hypothetical protein
VFAIVDDPKLGEEVASAMVAAYLRRNVKADWRVARVDERGARLLPAVEAPPVLRLV